MYLPCYFHHSSTILNDPIFLSLSELARLDHSGARMSPLGRTLFSVIMITAELYIVKVRVYAN